MKTKRITGSTFGLLRELEAHLCAVQISAETGTLPVASSRCSREILAKVLHSLGHSPDPNLPPIEEDDTEEVA